MTLDFRPQDRVAVRKDAWALAQRLLPERVGRRASRRIVVAAGIAAVGLVAIVAIAAADGALLPPWNAASAALGPPHFVDETGSAGIAHVYTPPEDLGIGGGVAVFDCNGDGRPDLYFAGGGQPAMLARNDSAIGGALRFTPIGDAVTNIGGVIGAYPLDVDGDGITDLAVLRVGGLDLLRGLGDCRFVPANAQWAVDAGNGWTTAFSATWEADAALPTLAVGNYLRLDAMGPAKYACDDNALLRPRPDGVGYAPPIPLSPGYCALSMLFSDWDRSGRQDLRVSNDRQYYDYVNGEEQLWRVAPGEPPRPYTSADGWVQMQIWGMGIASADLTGDGYPEVFLTSQGAESAPDADRRPDPADVRRHRAQARRERDLPVRRRHHAAIDRLARRVRRRQQRRLRRPVHRQGKRGRAARLCDAGPEQPPPRPARWHVRRRRSRGGTRGVRPRARRRPGRPQPGRPSRSRRGQAGARRRESGATSGRGAPSSRRRWATGSPCGRRRQARTGTRSARGSRSASATSCSAARSRSAAGTRVGSLAGSTSGSGRRREAQVRVHWPDGTIGPWQRVAADTFGIVARDAPCPWPGRRRHERRGPSRRTGRPA